MIRIKNYSASHIASLAYSKISNKPDIRPIRFERDTFRSSIKTSVNSACLILDKTKNLVADLLFKIFLGKLAKAMKTTPVESPEYVNNMLKVAAIFAGGKKIVVNQNNNMLKELGSSDEACIFIMNHDFQRQDPSLMSMFILLLYKEYLNNGKGASCPRPKFIVNQDILSVRSKKIRDLFVKLGAVSIDPYPDKSETKTLTNIKPMIALIKDFIEDKNHIFIFPEGQNGVNKESSTEERFQMGICKLIQQALKKKTSVKIIPLGFFHKTENFLKNKGSIYIGQPVCFKTKELDGQMVIEVSKSNITANTSPEYNEIFNGQEFLYLNGEKILNHIGGVLCENLSICKKLAYEQLGSIFYGHKPQKISVT